MFVMLTQQGFGAQWEKQRKQLCGSFWQQLCIK